MSIQFDRHYKVTVYRQSAASFGEVINTNIEITDLRMQCKIEKTLKSEPNKCEISITNLAEKTRAEFQHLPVRVNIEAGYQNELRLLFVGDVRPGFARSKHDGTDWVTNLILGDGLRAFAEARVNRAYKKGTPILNILRDVAKSMGMHLPAEVEQSPRLQAAVAAGEATVGWSADELTRLLAPYGYSWSSQNDKLQIVSDSIAPTNRIRELGEHTGMIGSPELGTPSNAKKNVNKPPNITIRHLLYPEIIPGEKIGLVTQGDLARLYKAERVSHTLDTHGDDWATEIEASPL